MITIGFLVEWALRSSLLILGGALLLRVLRVKDASIRLAAWTAMLCGSLAIPAMTVALPRATLTRPAADLGAVPLAEARLPDAGVERPDAVVSPRFDWTRAAEAVYAAVALGLLLRLCVGLAMSARLLRGSRATGRETDGIEIREAEGVRAPVTLGIVRPAIVLPADWREWDGAKLEAVLAHERSHIRRRDPALQALSAMHRAVLWHSPLSWFLHSRIVRTAEEASDDAAVAATRDRAFYAEVLLGFVQAPGGLGIPMARYDRPDQRIHRILDGTGLPRGVTRGSLAAILLLGLPLAYLVAAAVPQSAPEAAPQQAKPVKTPAPKPAADDRQTVAPGTPAQADAARDVLTGLGNVIASNTVSVKSRVDGELLSVSFKEGDLVQQGQLLATIDARPYEIQVEQAEAQVVQDQAALTNAHQELERYQRLVAQNMAPAPQMDSKAAEMAQLQGRLKGDEAALQGARLQVSYAHIVAPISGVVGLRQIDPGNIVHASDKTGILVITQLQPIAVVFEVPEDDLPQIRARLAQGTGLAAEAWNRDNTTRIATGRVTAVDNQIDLATGAVKLKAEFDNKDGALYPNQFVNVRLHLNSR